MTTLSSLSIAIIWMFFFGVTLLLLYLALGVWGRWRDETGGVEYHNEDDSPLDGR